MIKLQKGSYSHIGNFTVMGLLIFANLTALVYFPAPKPKFVCKCPCQCSTEVESPR